LAGDSLAAITGICHWTGGGIKKFVEILPPGIGAELSDMPTPPLVQLLGQAMAEGTEDQLTDLQAYETLHGGCAILATCKTKADAIRMIEELGADGHLASIVGKTTESKDNEVLINSKFKQGGTLTSKDLA
jgi:phosphoribosylaminoimidazole (AIR) synthetase